jgi:hypothetical protein
MVKKKGKVVRKRKPVVEENSSVAPGRKIFSKFKLGIVLRNLVLFILLFAISIILSELSTGVLADLFDFLWIIFAFISVAFFITLLVLLFLKLIRK